MPFGGGLYLSSMARAYFENMRPSRARKGRVARTLTRAELEERLDRLIRASGEAGVNRLRDNARMVATDLGMEREIAQLDTVIGALLGTRDSRLVSSVGRARSLRRPYDPDRMELFHGLHRALRNHPPSFRPSPPRDSVGRSTLAFFIALRALSRTGNPDPLIRVLDYAQHWTLAVNWAAIPDTARELEACNAFLASDEAEMKCLRLRMPG